MSGTHEHCARKVICHLYNIRLMLMHACILAVSCALLSKGVVRDEDVVLFTAAFRTFQRHASNLVEIHTLRELHDFWEKQKL